MSNKLKIVRRKKGFTQKDIADILNIGQGNISGYENGAYKLNEDQIRKLTKVLECSADYLLGLIEEDTIK